MTSISGQAAFDAVSAEFTQTASALVQRAGTLKKGPQRDALMASLTSEMDAVQAIIARLGRGGVPGEEFVAGLKEVRAATERLQSLSAAPSKRGLFGRR